jgi:uncharacterized membrane protein
MPKRLLTRLAEPIERVLDLGISWLLWPLALGAAAGLLTLEAWPSLGRFHPKYGAAAIVVAASLAVLLLAFVSSRFGRDEARFRRSVLGLRRFGSPLLLVLVAVTAGTGLERGHGFLVVALGLVAAWITAHWVRAWLPEESLTPRDVTDAAEPAADGTRPLVLVRWPAFVLGALVTAYTVLFSWLSIANHLSFNTSRADLGFYVSIFRRSSLGDPLGCSICGGGNHLSGHFDPILVLLSPLYLLYPEAETILVLQSFLLGITMVPLYWLGRHWGVSRTAALLVCGCYGLFPALHGVNLFDFHSLALLIPAAVWLLWARDTNREKTYWALFAVLLLVREDAALVAIVIGADTVLSRKPRSLSQGLITIAIGAAYFVAVKALLMGSPDPLQPSGSRGYAYYYKDLVPKDGGTAGLVSSVLTKPEKVLELISKEEKVLYWLQLLVPLLGLPLLAQRGRLLLAYGALFTLLASRPFVYSLHFHYSSVVIPFLFYLTLLALGRPHTATKLLTPLVGRGHLSGPRWQLLLALAMLSCTLLLSWRFGGILPNKTFHAGFRPLLRSPSAEDLNRDADLKAVCRAVPRDAVVAANEPHLPHLGRCGAYQVKKRRLQADYLVWTKHRPKNPRKNAAHRAVDSEIAKGYWKLERSFRTVELYRNVAPAAVRKAATKSKKAPAPRPSRKTPTAGERLGAASREGRAPADTRKALDGGAQ